MGGAWRVIDCSTAEATLSSVRGGIVVARKGASDVVVPTADVAVVLIGNAVKLGASVLHRLLSDDVIVLTCDWRGIPIGGAYSWNDHGRVGARHQAQANLSVPRRKNAWGRLIRAKVAGQISNVPPGSAPERRLRALLARVRSGDPENIEAQAARLYWSAVFEDRRFTRQPGRRAGDVNSFLDYGYAVMRGYGVRAVASAGLSGPLGLFHRGRANAFNLVDDLIEPFRPAVDEAVMGLLPEASMDDAGTKRLLVAAANRTFTASGATISTELENLAQQFGRYVEGEIEKLPVPQWAGPCESAAGGGMLDGRE